MIWLSAMLAVLLVSCDETTEGGIDLELDYFPLEIGNYIIYQVDSTTYDDFNDTIRQRTLFAREIVESTFIDASGRESYRIQREYRENTQQSWGAAGFDIWAAYSDDSKAERVEENQRYIKLVFPPRENKTWNGNIHINVDPDGDLGYLLNWEYEMVEVGISAQVDLLNFDTTLTVIQQSTGTLIDTTGSREVYAKDVGLIYKEIFVLETQCSSCDPGDAVCLQICQNSPWTSKAERGFIMKQSILEYGTL